MSAKLCKPFRNMEFRGINENAKREEVVDVFRVGKFELFALTNTELKVNEEVSWYGVNCIIVSVQEMERALERVAILFNDVWHSAIIDFGCFSFRISWIKFKILRVKVCVVLRYGPNEGDGEEKDIFWNERILDRVGNGYRLCILGDLNGWIGARTRAGITGCFRVSGENDNGREVVEFCAERRPRVADNYFKHISLHKYTRVARS